MRSDNTLRTTDRTLREDPQASLRSLIKRMPPTHRLSPTPAGAGNAAAARADRGPVNGGGQRDRHPSPQDVADSDSPRCAD